METNTIDQPAVDSARESLMSSISTKTDFSDFKSPDIDSGSSDAATTLNNPSESEPRSDSDASEPAQTSSQPKLEGVKTDAVASNQTEPQQKPRAPARLQQLIDQNKVKDAEIARRDAELAELRKSQPTAKPAEVKPLVPQPQPPQYSRETLSKVFNEARKSGDEALMATVQDQLEQWRQHDMKMLEWKMDNKEAIKNHNNDVNFFKQEALKKFDGLQDPNSPISREYVGIRGWMNQQMPELLGKPVSEYLLAQISAWKVDSGRLVATESALKQLQEKHDKLEKGSLPITSKTKVDLKGNDASDIATSDAKSNLMKQIQQANLGMTMR